MKFFLKRLNNKKGFTLIELIVVIAILAILALIAIPRFSGFTDKAKKGADDQYIALYENAVEVLTADGTISGLAGDATDVITFTESTGVPALGAGIAGAVVADFTAVVKTTPFVYYTSVSIQIDDMEGNTTVTATK